MFLNLDGQKLNRLGKYFIKNYQPSEYNGHPQNWSAIQGNDGIMYFGNNDGIIEYDGESWRKIPKPFDIRAFAKDDNGTIYVGGQNDIGYLERNEIGETKFHSLTDQLTEVQKNFYNTPSIVKYKDGICFIGFTNIFYFKDKKLENVWNSATAFSFGFNVDGRFFVREKERGLLEMIDDSLHIIHEGEQFKDQPIYMMENYDDNYIIIGTLNQGLLLMDKTNYHTKAFKTNADNYLLKYELYHGITLYKDYYLLVTSYGGALIIDKKGKVIQLFNKESGLDNDNSHYACIDQEENIWITTNNGFSYIETNSAISFFDNNSGYADIPTSINKYKGKYYIGTLQNLYSLELDTILTPYSINFHEFKAIQPESNSFMDIKIFDGELYAVYRDGIFKIENNKLIRKLEFEVCYRIHQINANPEYFLLCTSKGLILLKKKGDGFENLGNIGKLSGEVRVIVEDNNGDLWFDIAEEEIYRLRLHPESKAFEILKYDEEKGLKVDRPTLPTIFKNKLYIITRNNIFKYDYKSETFYETKAIQRLTDDYKDTIAYNGFSTYNNLTFANTNSHGIGSLKNNEYTGYCIDFTPFLRDPALAVFSTFFDTTNQLFWYSGTKKIHLFNYRTNKKFSLPFNTLIRRISVNDDSLISMGAYNNENPLSLDFSNNSISFEFAAVLFENNDAVKYSYKIENLDKSWSQWSSENKVKYPNIPHGEYIFKVKAINCYGTESNIAEYKFVISPPWYFEWWAFIIYFILLVVVVYLIVYLNSRRLKAINLKLEKIIDERTFEINQKNTELNKRNKLITDSIRYAKHIQEAVLPNEQILNKYFPESFIFFLPRDIVSGDFYWFSEHGNKLFIAAGDCTGHGVPGALMSIMGNTLLNEIVNEKKIYKPSEIFNQLNNRVIALLKQNEKDNQTRDDGMDISLCCFDKEKRTIEIASANHKVLIVKDNENIVIDGDIYSIGGMFSNKSDGGFYNNVVEYTENTQVYLYSDGYQDQFGGKENKKFMAEKFEHMILQNSQLNMNEQYKMIKSSFEEWKADHRQIDDILVIGIKV